MVAEKKPDAEAIQARIYAGMSPSQKWEQACRLREAAWALKKAALRGKHPGWSEQELEDAVRKIFLYATT